MMKAVCSSEALVRVYQTTRRRNLKHQTRFPLKERKNEHAIKMGETLNAHKISVRTRSM